MQSLYEDISISTPPKTASRREAERWIIAIKVGICCLAIVFSGWLVLRMYTGDGATDAQATAENEKIIQQFPSPAVQPTRAENPKVPNMH